MCAQNLPPRSEETEKSILGCMLLDRASLVTALDLLSEEDFTSEQNRLIFAAIAELYHRGSAVDYVTLLNQLISGGAIEQVGAVYLAQLTDIIPYTQNIEQYCKIVREKSALRSMITAFGNFVARCYEQKDSFTDILTDAEAYIYNLSISRTSGELTALRDIMVPLVIKIGEEFQKDIDFTGVPTGFTDLDALTNGLQNGDLILIAARPSMGKTALGLNIAQNAAFRYNKIVAFFSLEMSSEQLTYRIISSETGVDSKILRTPAAILSSYDKIAKMNQEVYDRDIQLFLDDTSGITVSDMRSKLRKLKSKKGLDLIVIDYMQLMSTNSRTENRQQEMSTISRELKGLAKELRCPLVALSQLSRSPEGRQNKRPILSDLRESGAIEQDADIVMMLYRDNYYNKEDANPTTELIVAKNRNGETKTIMLDFEAQYTRFKDSTYVPPEPSEGD